MNTLYFNTSSQQTSKSTKMPKPYEELHYFISRPQTIHVLHKKGIKYLFPIQY